MRTRLFFLLVVVLAFTPADVWSQSYADLVNPMVGTAAGGQTFPGVGMPFGMTQWTPATRDTEEKGVAPYFYEDHIFRGIRGSHFLSGSATQDYGSFQLLAGTGNFDWDGRAPSASFSHAAEHATPYLYEVEVPNCMFPPR
jgi:putative alpha-1,2-mannosidase